MKTPGGRTKNDQLPAHVGIILDGNGRWAKARGLSRSEGHRAGGEALDRMLEHVLEVGIPAVSLYAFSTENWKRPKSEIAGLWSLMNQFFESRFEKCLEKGIRVTASGDLSKLPAKNRALIEKVISATAKGKGLTANFCVNYGSHDEILHAAGRIVEERLALAKTGNVKAARRPVTKKEFEKYLYTHPLPPVDLMVRPGGESRLSNFLLWQSAYAEIYITPVLWPDFDGKCMDEALAWYAGRVRRFGGL